MAMMMDPLRATAVALLLMLASCARPGLWSARLDPALEKLIPPDTTMLLEVNLARLRTTPAWDKYVSQMASRQLSDFTLRTGIDARRDLDQLLLASDGHHIITLVRGRFHPDDAAARLRSAGVRENRYNGNSVFEQDRRAIAFLDASTAVAGDQAGVRSILDQQKAGGGGIPPALRPVVAALPADDQIWAALAGGVPTFEAPGNLQNLVELARTVDVASVGADLRHGLDIHARADCRSPEDARRVHDALRGFLALARMSAPANRPDLVRIYDAVNVVRENTQVRMTAALSQQDLDTFLGLWLRQR